MRESDEPAVRCICDVKSVDEQMIKDSKFNIPSEYKLIYFKLIKVSLTPLRPTFGLLYYCQMNI